MLRYCISDGLVAGQMDGWVNGGKDCHNEYRLQHGNFSVRIVNYAISLFMLSALKKLNQLRKG